MAAVALTNVVHHLRSLAGPEPSDAQLLARFLSTGDNTAFAALVRRHGRLVLGVCRRLLGTGPDHEDVFQATFVILARRAGAIRKQSSVASWLYGVAYRLALQLKAQRARRRRRETTADTPLDQIAETQTMRADPTARASMRELGTILDEELQRLPAGCRDALVLCHLEGLSNTEAADHLGWPLGTLKGRVQRGRELLRQRLQKRGVALSAMALTVALAEQATAAVPAALLRTAARCASPATVPAQVAALADGASPALAAGKLKLALAAVFAAAVLSAAGGLRPFPAAGADPVVAEAPQAKDAPAGKDMEGDPLPPGATVRLGTLRWRQPTPVGIISVSADGKTVVSAGADKLIRVWEFDTGKEIRHFGAGKVDGGKLAADDLARLAAARQALLAGLGSRRAGLALSADGKLAAMIVDDRGVVQILETATGKVVKNLSVGTDPVIAALTFSPDGKHLAVAGSTTVLSVWDIDTGKVVKTMGQAPKDMNVIAIARTSAQLVYSPDGKMLAYAPPDSLRVVKAPEIQIWDAATGKELGTHKVETRFGFSAAVFSPSNKLLAYATVDGEVGVMVAVGGKLLHKWSIANRQESPAVAFSADSTKVYTKVAGSRIVREWDVATGKELRKLGEAADDGPTRPSNTTGCLVLTSDGKTLAVGGDGNAIRFVDLATGKDLPQPTGHSQPLAVVAYAPDGKTLLTRDDRTARLWDAATGKQLKQLAVPAKAGTFAATPDGKTLAVADERFGLTLVDGATGKEIAPVGTLGKSPPVFAFAPDGKTLAVRRFTEEGVVLFDVATGKERCKVGQGIVKPAVNNPITDGAGTFFFAPDGQRILVCGPTKAAVIYDTVTGRQVQKFEFEDGVRSAAFAPDGRLLALDRGDGVVEVVELATGKVRRVFGQQETKTPVVRPPGGATGAGGRGPVLGPPGLSSVAFSPDGRLLAYTGSKGALMIWDVATGKTAAKFEGHQGAIGAVAFAPDGTAVATGSTDTTGLIWDVKGLSAKAGPAAAALDEKAVKARWEELASADAKTGGEAINHLVGAPREAVALLAKQLQSANPADGKRIEALIALLDSSAFKVRQKALTELLEIGDRVLPFVEKALAAKPPLEAQQRLEIVQAKLSPGALSGDRLRQVRAIEVLERISTAEAREVLQALADGAPAALPTTHAQAALARMKKGN
jgi:RNA polymerase sigma factor (sigma-70 family)